MLQPTQPQTQPQQPSTEALPTEGMMTPTIPNTDPTAIPEAAAEESSIEQQLQAHLDQIPDDQKQFLAEHLTQEFVRAIGIINGPEVASYLAKFVDPDKVLVPVPRKVAEEHLAQEKAKGQAPAQPQTPGPAPAAPAAPPSAPQGGMMSPSV